MAYIKYSSAAYSENEKMNLDQLILFGHVYEMDKIAYLNVEISIGGKFYHLDTGGLFYSVREIRRFLSSVDNTGEGFYVVNDDDDIVSFSGKAGNMLVIASQGLVKSKEYGVSWPELRNSLTDELGRLSEVARKYEKIS